MARKKKVVLGTFAKGLILSTKICCALAFVYAGLLSWQGYGLLGERGYEFAAEPSYDSSRVFFYRSMSLREGSLGGPSHRGGGLGGGK